MCRTSTITPENKEFALNFEQESTVVPPQKDARDKGLNITLADFFDTSKPWILVPNGSLKGFYDFVPSCFREGPWNLSCCIYLAVVVYGILFLAVDSIYSRPPPPQEYTSYPAYSYQWWYNVFGFAWTLLVSGYVAKSDFGYYAWGSFTLQSWTLIVLRHGLSALVPFVPSVAAANEALRFPMLAQATITFTIFNFALAPAILTTMKDPKARAGFIKLITSFLLTQLHVFNIVFAGISGIWGSPRRDLNQVDISVALLFALQYVLFYLLVFDRLGIHIYFIFSPRTPLALLSWSFFIGSYFGCFSLWKTLTLQYGVPV